MTNGTPGGAGGLAGFFGLRARGTDVKTEVVAGATTFMTMAYILFVNPMILTAVPDVTGAKLSFPALLTSTALVAALATLAMGLLANLPLALAAGMGLNSVVAFQLVAGMKLTWPQAMGVIVAEGLVISALVATGLRQAVVRAVPVSMKKAIGIGIGLFLAIIGFVDAGFVSRNAADPVPVALGTGGHLRGFPVVLFVLTLLFTGWLVFRNVKGALLIGIVASTVVAVVAKLAFGDAAGFKNVVLPSSPLALPDFSQVGNFSFGFVQRSAGRPRRSPCSRSCSPTSSTPWARWWPSGRRRSTWTPRALPAPGHRPHGRLARRGGGRRRRRLVRDDLHRERRGRGGGRPDRARLGRDRAPVRRVPLHLAARGRRAGRRRPAPCSSSSASS